MLTCKGDGTVEGFDRYRVGLNAAAFASDVTFGGGIDPYIERRAVTATFDVHPGLASTLSFGAGVGLGGRLAFMDHALPVRETIDPGWLVTFAWSQRLVDGLGKKPFVLVSLSAGASGAGTHATAPAAAGPTEQLYAFDVRGGVTVGKTFFQTLSPYAAARIFGGPILWTYRGKSELGTDQRHVQLAVGMVTRLPAGFDAFAEVAPAFERGVTVGAGRSF
ncbi:MAG TPA: hypothetical protein VHB21_23610 [Minicystis sp.]|nr:hypothetical protein [Minicystis sp.]